MGASEANEIAIIAVAVGTLPRKVTFGLLTSGEVTIDGTPSPRLCALVADNPTTRRTALARTRRRRRTSG